MLLTFFLEEKRSKKKNKFFSSHCIAAVLDGSKTNLVSVGEEKCFLRCRRTEEYYLRLSIKRSNSLYILHLKKKLQIKVRKIYKKQFFFFRSTQLLFFKRNFFASVYFSVLPCPSSSFSFFANTYSSTISKSQRGRTGRKRREKRGKEEKWNNFKWYRRFLWTDK